MPDRGDGFRIARHQDRLAALGTLDRFSCHLRVGVLQDHPAAWTGELDDGGHGSGTFSLKGKTAYNECLIHNEHRSNEDCRRFVISPVVQTVPSSSVVHPAGWSVLPG